MRVEYMRRLLRRRLAWFLLPPACGILISAGLAWAGPYEDGMRLYREGEYQEAARAFRQVLTTDADNPNVRYYLADSLLKTSRLAEAQAEYQRIIEIAPYSQAARLSKTALGKIKDYVSMNSGGTRWSLSSASGGQRSDSLSGLSANGEDYLSEITSAGQYVRWSLLKMPLKIYVEKNPKNIAHFEPGYISTVGDSMDVWVRVLGGQLQYKLVDSPEHADIQVFWVNGIDKHGFMKDNAVMFTAGLTTPTIENQQLKRMKLQIATLNVKRQPQSRQDILYTMVHELGHALGLLGHSLHMGDIMFSQSAESMTLMPRDIATIRRLYMQESDITNAPPDPKKLKDPARDLQMAMAVDKSIAKYENLVKTYGDALNWLNLGANYEKKAELLNRLAANKKDPQQQPAFWYQKAAGAYTQALKQEPQDVKSLSRRADVAVKLGNTTGALEDLQLAMRYEPKNADLYLQQASILASLGRKLEAQSALNTYKTLAPSVDASSVERIQAKL